MALGYAADIETGKPLKPAAASSAAPVSVKPKVLSNDVGLRVYLAIAKDSIELCRTQKCKDEFKQKVRIRYIGEGKCKKIDKDSTADACLAIQSRKCASLKKTIEGESCYAILTGGVRDVERVFQVWKVTEPEITREQVAESLAMAAGYYRFNNMKACQKYLDAYPSKEKPYISMFACQILFAPDPEKAWRKAEGDAVYFERARLGEQGMCYKVKSAALREMCFK
jgi:hypothetical protein